MKAIIYPWRTVVHQTDAEAMEYCRPGEGANTCSWLLRSSEGWQCCCLNKTAFPNLVKQHVEGTMSALRDGCDKVNNFDPSANWINDGREVSEVEF